MDVYGGLLVDDLLDLPNDDLIFSSNSSSSSSSAAANATTISNFHHHPSAATHFHDSPVPTYNSTDFTDALFIPTDDAAELEWVSNYMDDSYADFPTNTLTTTSTHLYNAAFHGRARTKRSRPPTNPDRLNDIVARNRNNNNFASAEDTVTRRCSHCASEKTPQWRTGPMGPKTLCNACGVRYKSGRLVPEYRPAASPTFVLTQHSNSHRKVMELRRQKEVIRHHHPHHQLMQ